MRLPDELADAGPLLAEVQQRGRGAAPSHLVDETAEGDVVPRPRAPVGAHEEVARYSGISIVKTRTIAYMIQGAGVAIAAIAYVTRRIILAVRDRRR